MTGNRSNPNPTALEFLMPIFTDPNLRVLCIGDDEIFNNQMRRFGRELVRQLISNGLTHFALESPSEFLQPLSNFIVSGNDQDIEPLRPTAWFGNLDVQAPRTPDRPFFDMLLELRSGIPLLCVDETERPTGRYLYRDLHMRDEIMAIPNIRTTAKVVLWGGFTHHYFRDEQTDFRTVVELLRAELEPESVFSICSVSGRSFEIRRTTEQDREIEMRKGTRCSGGICFGSACRATCRILNPPDSYQEITLDLWDSFICFGKNLPERNN